MAQFILLKVKCGGVIRNSAMVHSFVGSLEGSPFFQFKYGLFISTSGLLIPLHHLSIDGQPKDCAEIQYLTGSTLLAVIINLQNVLSAAKI